jgi:hypothetical protein
MEVQESSKQFRWYLHEYANTSSLREGFVPKHNWGCSEFLTIAANFLQRNIYVLPYDADEKQLWYCSGYRPSTMSRGKKVFETGRQVSLQLVDCLAAIRKEKNEIEAKESAGAPLLGQTLLGVCARWIAGELQPRNRDAT